MDYTLKKPYEISLWEDELVYVVSFYENKNSETPIKTEEFTSLENFPNPDDYYTRVERQYYKEKKILILGSDSMSSPIRAFEPKLRTNVNGSSTLTFSIYYRYYDEDAEDYFSHPYVQYLVNERKIKLRYGALGEPGTKWYDFIIKNVEENSEKKTFTYTAQDIFINELSKSGFGLVFDPEKENSIGTIETLAGRVLEESDWKLKGFDLFKERTQEPLYKIQLNRDIVAMPVLNITDEAEKITIKAGEFIYVFYSVMKNEEGLFQFIYREDGNYTYDDNYTVDNATNYYYDGTMTYSQGRPFIAASVNEENGISREIYPDFQGYRYVHGIQTEYDSKIDKYITVYKDAEGRHIYGFTETEYVSVTTVKNYITSPKDFSSYDGWKLGSGKEDQGARPNLRNLMIPDARDIVDPNHIEEAKSYLGVTLNAADQELYNSGFGDNRLEFKKLTWGDKYVFKLKYGIPYTEPGKPRPNQILATSDKISFSIREYEIDYLSGDYTFINTKGESLPVYFQGEINPAGGNSIEGIYATTSSLITLSEEELLTKRVGIFFTFEKMGQEYLIQEASFFKYIENDGVMVEPDNVPTAKTKIRYYYYDPTIFYTNIKDLQFLYDGYEPCPDFMEAIKTGEARFEKIRSLSAKESNRFNIIQNLCELFECWAKFEIEHNELTGEIKLGKDKNWYDENNNFIPCPEEEKYRQQKFVSFREYVGTQNNRGFKYGVNLKSVSRKLDSSGSVSKIIVKDNSNEFGDSGFCSIMRAKDNPSGENFIYDFSYYVSQKLLRFSEINNDLYDRTTGFLGYYSHLRDYNEQTRLYNEGLGGLAIDIMHYEADKQTYTSSVTQSQELLQTEYNAVYNLCLLTFEELYALRDKVNSGKATEEERKTFESWWENEELASSINKIVQLRLTHGAHSKLLKETEEKLSVALGRQEDLSEEVKKLTEKRKELHSKFNQKYSRFIQEGSWISEDYYDDNLYFLDAKSTLHTSSQPQVTYTINVLELSQIEGYENYTFALGDRTFIEDTEFFGWKRLPDGFYEPRQEEIVVTEIALDLDSPEKNQIKVQNYKTQFEDLFSRITAATQAIEYSTGRYEKVSQVVEDDGTIKASILQNSIANNELILSNSANQSVVWDSTGITTTNLTNPSEKLRIVSGGLFISNDGGLTWRTGVRGDGIVTDILTSGQLDTERIHIMNGSAPSFRWDKLGINAFRVNSSGGVNTGTFVRFDQYGLYGIQGLTSFDPNVLTREGKEPYKSPEEKIKDLANFSLTWSGFQLRSNRNDGSEGYLSISNDNDLQVMVKDQSGKFVERVKIGSLGNEKYGLAIRDNGGNAVMRTDSEGKLFLTQYLRIGPESGNETRDRVKLGIVKTYDAGQNEYSKILSIKDMDGTPETTPALEAQEKLAIYDDGTIIAGKLRAENAYIEGEIHASKGTIGGLTISEWKGVGYEVAIVSNSGVIFQAGDTTKKTLTAILYRGGRPVRDRNLTYQWYENGLALDGETRPDLLVGADDFEGTATYTCEIEIVEMAGEN